MEAPDQRSRLVSRRQARVRRPAGRRLSDGAAKESNLPGAVEAPPTALKAVRGTGPGPLHEGDAAHRTVVVPGGPSTRRPTTTPPATARSGAAAASTAASRPPEVVASVMRRARQASTS